MVFVQAATRTMNVIMHHLIAFDNNIQWFSIKVNGKLKIANSKVYAPNVQLCQCIYCIYLALANDAVGLQD